MSLEISWGELVNTAISNHKAPQQEQQGCRFESPGYSEQTRHRMKVKGTWDGY